MAVRMRLPPMFGVYGVLTYVENTSKTDDFIVFKAGDHTYSVKLRRPEMRRAAGSVLAVSL